MEGLKDCYLDGSKSDRPMSILKAKLETGIKLRNTRIDFRNNDVDMYDGWWLTNNRFEKDPTIQEQLDKWEDDKNYYYENTFGIDHYDPEADIWVSDQAGVYYNLEAYYPGMYITREVEKAAEEYEKRPFLRKQVLEYLKTK
jgi:hypothetical protein